MPLKGPAAQWGQAEASVVQWRARALDHLLWAGVTISLAPIAVLLLILPEAAPSGPFLSSLALYLLLIGLALARPLPHLVRGWGLLVVGFGFAALTFSATGLEGSGRVFLVAMPLYAVILLGSRSGYLALALSLALYAGAALLLDLGLLTPGSPARLAASEGEFWLLQGAMLMVVLGPLFLLVSRFIRLLHGSALAERKAAGQIAETDRERRRLELVLLETGERERRAIGHQLHDGPCQQITAALLRCKVAQKTATARGDGEGLDHLGAIAEMLDASAGEIHDLARGLSPPELSPGALVAALSDLARRVRDSGPVDCEFAHDGIAPSRAVGTSSQLFRIAQEAVSNAVRHSGARRIRIELSGDLTSLRLRILDDGVGLPPEGDRGGMGLRVMRHRAELMGAALSIGPAAGGGTEVVCALPLPPPGAVSEEGP